MASPTRPRAPATWAADAATVAATPASGSDRKRAAVSSVGGRAGAPRPATRGELTRLRATSPRLRGKGRSPSRLRVPTKRPDTDHHATATMETPPDVVSRAVPPGTALPREEALVGSQDARTASPGGDLLKVVRRSRTDPPLGPVRRTDGLRPGAEATARAQPTPGASAPESQRASHAATWTGTAVIPWMQPSRGEAQGSNERPPVETLDRRNGLAGGSRP